MSTTTEHPIVRLQHLLVLAPQSTEHDIRQTCMRVNEIEIDVDHIDREDDGSCAIEVSHWIVPEFESTRIALVRERLADLYQGSRILSTEEYVANV